MRAGSVDDLRGDTVALSQVGAELFGAGVGQRVALHLADGTPVHPAAVVAVYGNGLGFGDLTLPRDVLLAHNPNGLDDVVLVKADHDAVAVRTALDGIAARYLGVDVLDRAGFTAARQDQVEMQGPATALLLMAVFAYIAIGVANTLVMATAARRREFALLRLVGADRRQVRGMMRAESFVVVLIAAVLGTMSAIPPLVGVSLGLSERTDPHPVVDVPVYLAILGVTALIALLSTAIPTRPAMRTRPVEAIGLPE